MFDKLVYGKLRAALGGRVNNAVSGGAPLGDRLDHFFRGIGVTILEGYGLTETSAGSNLNRPDALKVGTVGQPWTSGTFGCVRSGGWQMHEGLDIRCLQRDKHGEPLDPVLATWRFGKNHRRTETVSTMVM